MPGFKNAMEIFRLLPGNNCRKCLVPTCLAFAVAAFKGDRRLSDCPYMDRSILGTYEGHAPQWMITEQEYRKALEPLKRKVSTVDFPSSTERLGASLGGPVPGMIGTQERNREVTRGRFWASCFCPLWFPKPTTKLTYTCVTWVMHQHIPALIIAEMGMVNIQA